ncbi:hypothetical protein ACQ4LE_004109 [Meloidogyne hapla]
MRGLRQKRHRRARSNSSTTKRSPTPVADQIEQWRLEAAIVSMLTLTDKDNRLISPPFRVLPTPQEFPLYYEHIKKPIDLRKISENIRAGKYQTWSGLKEDVQLMCKNARDFNEPGSTVHKDANILLRHFKHRSAELVGARRFSPRVISRNTEIIDELLHSTESEVNDFSEDSEEDEDSERSDDPRWRLYWAIRNYDVVDGVPLCENFIELPCKRSYPDYYEEIERPLSLYMINKMLKRGHYANLDALVQDLLLMFDNAMSYNIEESGIYQAAVRCRHLTLKAAKALNASDRGNGNSLDCNIEHNEINKFSPASKKVKITNSVNPTYNGFASAEQKVVPSHFHTEPQQQQTGERIQSFHQNYIQPTGPSTSSTQAQFFQCSASTSSVQQNSLNSTSNHSILASDSSQLLLTNVPSTVVSQSCQGQSSSTTSPFIQSHLLTSTTAVKNVTVNAFQNYQRKQKTHIPGTFLPNQSVSTLNQRNLSDTGRMFVSLAPKQMPIEPMFASPSTSIHIRRVVHSEAYIRYLESMHNLGTGKQQRNVSKWDKTLLASAKNTVVPEHKRLPYEWIRNSNNSKHKEDEVVRALWKLRDNIVEGTTGIARSQGIPYEADAPEPPLVTTARKGRPPKNVNTYNKNS